MKKLTNEEVRAFLAEKGYTLLSEYKNSKTRMQYICSCGNIVWDELGQIRKKNGCKDCVVQCNEYTFEDVKNFFETTDCTLLSTSYVNNLHPLEFICECGNKSKTGFFHFKNGRRCVDCGRKRAAEANIKRWDKKGRQTKEGHWKKRMEALRKRKANDPAIRLKLSLRARIIDVIKKQGGYKSEKTLDLLGCTHEEFQNYIASKFTEGMSWNNYGRHGWVLDHIIPCSYFNLKNAEDQKLCFHHTNYQPLWFIDNALKGDKLPDGTRGRDKTKI